MGDEAAQTDGDNDGNNAITTLLQYDNITPSEQQQQQEQQEKPVAVGQLRT